MGNAKLPATTISAVNSATSPTVEWGLSTVGEVDHQADSGKGNYQDVGPTGLPLRFSPSDYLRPALLHRESRSKPSTLSLPHLPSSLQSGMQPYSVSIAPLRPCRGAIKDESMASVNSRARRYRAIATYVRQTILKRQAVSCLPCLPMLQSLIENSPGRIPFRSFLYQGNL